MKLRNQKKNFFILLILFLSSFSFGAQSKYPTPIIIADDSVNKILENGNNKLIYDQEISPGLALEYYQMWKEFDQRGKASLPKCVYEAVNNLKKKSQIKIGFTILRLQEFPSGGVSISTAPEEYSKKKEIWIYGLWKEFYRDEDLSEKRYCLKALLFHEILHYAFDINYNQDNKTLFNIRQQTEKIEGIDNPRRDIVNSCVW
jgi:hypothetical protein